jgi:putative molybdopterin biosynthesis protein
MSPMTAAAGMPGPQDAYHRWGAACTAAGWHARPVVEQVPVRDGLGRVTAAALAARWPSPRFACAAMDGIAVAAGSPDGLPPAEPGQRLLQAATFSWVDTGDPLPAGMDAVVERERVELRADGTALVTGPVTRGRNVRLAGEDFRDGELLIPAGRRLRPADLSAAATAGHAALPVARQPVVAIIPTGDEIRPVGSVLGPGEFTDTNSLLLAARASQAGAIPMVADVQPDDPDVLAAAAREAALGADLVLVIAGSSRGRGDYTAAVLEQVGGLAIAGVAVRPGHPVLLGYVKPGRSGPPLPGGARAAPPSGAVPAIGVPGYPLASAVIFELFAAPLLAQVQGSLVPDPDRLPLHARLGCDWSSPPDVEDWVLVSLNVAGEAAGLPGGHLIATPDKGRGAGAISRLVRADAWWRIPIGQGQFVSGADIHVQPTST